MVKRKYIILCRISCVWSIHNTDVSIFIYACACNKIGVFEVTAFGRAPTPTVICVGVCRSLSLMESMNQLLVHRLQKTAQQREREGEGEMQHCEMHHITLVKRDSLSSNHSFYPSLHLMNGLLPLLFADISSPPLIFIQSLHLLFFHFTLKANIKGTGAEIIIGCKLISLSFCCASVTPPRLSTLF